MEVCYEGYEGLGYARWGYYYFAPLHRNHEKYSTVQNREPDVRSLQLSG